MGQKQKTDPHHHLKETAQRFLSVVSTTLEEGTVKTYRTSVFQFIHFLNTYYPEITRFSQLRRSPHIEKWLSDLVRGSLCSKTRRLHIRGPSWIRAFCGGSEKKKHKQKANETEFLFLSSMSPSSTLQNFARPLFHLSVCQKNPFSHKTRLTYFLK